MIDIILSPEGFWSIFTLVFIFAFFAYLGIKLSKLIKEEPRPLIIEEKKTEA